MIYVGCHFTSYQGNVMFLRYQFLRLQNQLEARKEIVARNRQKGFHILTYLSQRVPLLIFIAIKQFCLTPNFVSFFQQCCDPCPVTNCYHIQQWPGFLNKIMFDFYIQQFTFLWKMKTKESSHFNEKAFEIMDIVFRLLKL